MVLLTRATRARTQSQENDAQLGVKGGMSKKQPAAQANKRRVLGDVSNLLVARDQGVKGKDAKAKDAKAKGAAPAPAPAPKAEQPAEAPTAMETEAPVALRTRGRSRGASLDGAARMMSAGGRDASGPAGSRRTSGISSLPDIDKADQGNVLAATDYVADIYSYFKEVENKFRASPEYMERQPDINHKMRAILIDWLTDVHLKFKLVPETLYLCVNLTDRFLDAKTVTRKNLQLVGMVAMLIASKYEDIWAPEVKDFVYMCDKAYTRDQILQMENVMLKTLKYHLSLPTQYSFQTRFIKAANMHLDAKVCNLSTYLLELSLVSYSMLCFSPSITSAAATYVAMRVTNNSAPYPKALAAHSGYARAQILPCAKALVTLMKGASEGSLTAVHRKYSSAKFLEVAKERTPVEILNE